MSLVDKISSIVDAYLQEVGAYTYIYPKLREAVASNVYDTVVRRHILPEDVDQVQEVIAEVMDNMALAAKEGTLLLKSRQSFEALCDGASCVVRKDRRGKWEYKVTTDKGREKWLEVPESLQDKVKFVDEEVVK